jgi:polyhydroxyalkanoate synthase subunit PhaC
MKGLSTLATLWARPRPLVGTTPSDVVHHENKWRLLRYRPGPAGIVHRTPILLVPSLINRHYVLDLLPQRSFAAYMVAQGHEVYIIDWGTPGDEDRYLTFDTICDRYLGRAIRLVARASERGKAHLLGYCLGGTLTAIHASVRPERVASLAVMAAPVRFADDGLLSAWTRDPRFDVGALVEGTGNVPWELMQSAFQMLRPTLNASKLVNFLDRAWTDESLDGFLAVETWGSDNVSFPGACYRRYVEELYQKDALIDGTFTLSGLPARLENITCPTLAVTFEDDNIVPWRSASALIDSVGAEDKQRIHLPGGHVGAVVSQKASKTLWPQLSAWWAARDGETSALTQPVPALARAPRKASAKAG